MHRNIINSPNARLSCHKETVESACDVLAISHLPLTEESGMKFFVFFKSRDDADLAHIIPPGE